MVFVTADDGGIMAGVAVVEVAGGEIDESEEESDEHAALIVFTAEGIVNAGADFCRHHALFG